MEKVKQNLREQSNTDSNPKNGAYDIKFCITEEDKVYIAQLKELVQIFSSIENPNIRQYIINISSEILKLSHNEVTLKEYIKDLSTNPFSKRETILLDETI
jgi:hypothetical protein